MSKIRIEATTEKSNMDAEERKKQHKDALLKRASEIRDEIAMLRRQNRPSDVSFIEELEAELAIIHSTLSRYG